MVDVRQHWQDARLEGLFWRLRALLVLVHWHLSGLLPRSPLRCKPSAGQVLGHVLAALLTTGCASLPAELPRQYSEALAPVAGTRLAQVVQASAAGRDAGLSGFRLLPDGDHALDARLALARRAQVSLDIQYYLIAADDVGRRFVAELARAAARGVRVRLLVDDLHAGAANALLAGVAAQPNVEVRLFNPLPARGGRTATRVLLSLHEFERINRRMHNKLFIADGTLAVAGGRNIADDYFKRGEPSNFIDVDVLASGPVVQEFALLFDRFWNSPQAWPVQALVPRRLAPPMPDVEVDVDTDLPVSAVDRYGRSPVAAQLDAGRLDQHFAPARLLADRPDKAAPGPSTAAATAAQTPDSALDGALQAMLAARSEVLLATPYLVPGARGLAMIRQALDNRVRLVMMTNALAATDEPLVHWGYMRYRAAMVGMGVELHELSPTLGASAAARGDTGSSLGRLHAKLAVIDRRQLLVGSMNMDGRSRLTNTEIGVLIDSPALAAEVAQTLQRDLETSAWRLRAAVKPARLEWVAAEAGREVVRVAEPDTGWLRQLRLDLMSLFVAEELL